MRENGVRESTQRDIFTVSTKLGAGEENRNWKRPIEKER